MQVLTNGIEVKLQRNALSVIEAPTGHEEDDDIGCENLQLNGSDMGAFICTLRLFFSGLWLVDISPLYLKGFSDNSSFHILFQLLTTHVSLKE